ncbi:hypothetical protein DSL72_006501 [Monilinia vaccinii-corymbosi]|uniref:Uncharacterized protein n=1 Tax=Monilinia vaccinii-corymbosi TaxID=61207 RepID=A0A8A3PP17_9HELO|nr:hypothetical protein DSL72_006501 [Monilinia vaccinii-corymbosi]
MLMPLLSNGVVRGYKALQEVIERRDKATVHLLIGLGADVDAPAGEYNGTALQEAVKKGYIEIVALLLEAGADINAPAVISKWLGVYVQPRYCNQRSYEGRQFHDRGYVDSSWGSRSIWD